MEMGKTYINKEFVNNDFENLVYMIAVRAMVYPKFFKAMQTLYACMMFSHLTQV